jgi:hypothetical protein
LIEYFKTGGIYDPIQNTWEGIDTLNAPAPRLDHKAVWTGRKMMLWGGFNPGINNSLNTGGIFETLQLTPVVNTNNNAMGFRLNQNYPNPFNPVTNIYYDIPAQGQVYLSVFDVLGKEVAVLVSGIQNKGTHHVRWDASSLSSGVYFYRITYGPQTDIKKMILIK